MNFCHQDGLFDWILDGREIDGGYKLHTKSSIKFGFCIKKFMPSISKSAEKAGKPPRRYRVRYGAIIKAGTDERRPPVDEFHFVGTHGDGRHKRYFIEWKPVNS